MDILEQQKENVKRHPWELARFQVLLDLINSALPVDGEIKRVVDIGCGDCFFAEQLLIARPDILVTGIDPAYSKSELESKLELINNDRFTLHQSITEARKILIGKEIQLVLLLDVIEHIENDVEFLRTAYSDLQIGKAALWLISVPAFQSLFTAHDEFLKHFRRYNLGELKKTVNEAGFASLKSGYFFTSLLPLRFIQKLKQKSGLNPKQNGVGNWKGSDLITRFFKNYLLFDFKFSKQLDKAGLKLPGLSVYCLCQRPV